MFTDNWNWFKLSRSVPISDIKKYPHLPWDPWGISYNPTVTIDDLDYLGIYDEAIRWNWEWYSDSRSEISTDNISIVDVYIHPDRIWNRDILSDNKDIRVSDLIAWHEISPCIYSRWNYPSDVTII